jgi:hypothetical protein
MKLLIMQFSPTSCHFMPLPSKYSPQHHVLKQYTYIGRMSTKNAHSQPVPSFDGLKFTACQYQSRQVTSCCYCVRKCYFSPTDVTQTQRNFKCSLSKLEGLETCNDSQLSFTCSLPDFGSNLKLIGSAGKNPLLGISIWTTPISFGTKA